ncbi:LOW QUALITY PROTEIN: solute carrier family 46 member 3-like [Bombyx mandarina]|uniref:LOW QUALITY PROTEIN: solute carrier family 46 member 3-like n=1 Tax=Bombyx mandarina TaxID=7092 RepID=A0A6J2JBH5_BOMMA|nr:LOW QUALITY PROTEIN: solute carrier family 46 member 3-like [Bombyx mandarina]
MATTLNEEISIQETEALNTPNNVEIKKKTGFRYLLGIITVEPVAFIVLFASILSSMSTQTLGLEKACRVSLRLEDAICDSLRAQNQSNNFTDYERIVQEHYSAQLTWKSNLQSVLPLPMLLFAGGWSDKTGRRKAIIIFPIIGETLQCISNILNVVFFYEIPLEALIFFDTFFAGITGGTTIMFLAMFNYICDITTSKNRTQRLALVNLCTFAGMPLGLMLSGIMLRHLGYYAIYGTALFLHFINVLYVTFRVKDPLRTKEQIMTYDNKGCCHFLKEFFDPKTLKDSFKVLIKKTEDNRRLYLIVILMTACLLYGPVYGEVSVLYLSLRYRFNWDEMQFSLFQTYNFVITAIGTIFAVVVLSNYLKWHDALLGITSTISKIASSFVYCFAPNAQILYIAPVVDILNNCNARNKIDVFKAGRVK